MTGRRLLAAAILALACSRRPLREWRPEDHDSGVSSNGPAAEQVPNDDPNAAARALFAAQCASCHGSGGRGDGPMSAIFHPADLTNATLQSTRTDDNLATAITRGRGRMPAFGATLRPEAVTALVRLIRSWR